MPRTSPGAPPTTALFSAADSSDMASVKARADAVASNSRAGIEKWLRGMNGCTLIAGHARFESPGHYPCGRGAPDSNAHLHQCRRPCRGALPARRREVPYLTNTTMLALDRLPRHLVVVGGSYVGLEFAQMYRRFGAEVTIVEKSPRLIARKTRTSPRPSGTSCNARA